MLRTAHAGRVAVGHPVDVASGDFFAKHVDVEVGGLVPLTLERHYNSSWTRERALDSAAPSADASAFGLGYRASWDVELRRTLEGFTFVTAAGAAHTFADEGKRGRRFEDTGRLLAPADGLELSRIDEGRLRVVRYGVDRDPLSHVFVASRPGGPYALERIERTAASHVAFQRDALGRVVTLVQARERRSLHVVWNGSRVVQALLRFADGSTVVATEYAYDARGLLEVVRDRFGHRERYAYDREQRLVTETKRSGTVYTVRYDTQGRCNYVSGSAAYEERSLRWDDAARQCFVRDSHGATTLYEYNEVGQVLRIRTPLGQEERTELDELGRVTATTLPDGGRYVTEFDDAGHVVAVLQPDGTRRTFEHDEEHRLVAMTDETGYRACFERGPGSTLTRVLLPSTPPWSFEHDAFGALVGITDPQGRSRSFAYDGAGNRIFETDWRGHGWDGLYDGRGRLVASRDPLGGVTEYRFDDDGTDGTEPVAVTFADGRTWYRRWNLPRTELTVTRPDGRVVVARYSECRALVELVDEDACITRLTWDSEPGRLLRIVNGKGDVYGFVYDDDGQVVEQRPFDGRVYRYRWQNGRVVEAIGPSGRAATFAYDAMGRMIERRDADGTTHFAYDERGNMTAVTGPSGTLTFTYDEHGFRVGEAQESATLSRGYDVVGNPTYLATSFGPRIEYGSDENGDCVELRYGDVRVTLERDALGREVRRGLPGAGILEQAYDPVGRLVEQRMTGRGGATIVHRELGYDVAGNLAALRDSLRGTTELLRDGRLDLTAAVRQSGPSDFAAYDAAANRIYETRSLQGPEVLARAMVEGLERLFTLAEELGGASTAHTYAAGNRLLQTRGPYRSVDYAYDTDGQVTHRRVSDANGERTLALRWNAKGQLVEARLPGGGVWRYRYDPLGRRIAKRAPDGRETRYVWDGYHLLAEHKPDGQRITWPALPGTASPVLADAGSLAYVVPNATGAPSEVVGPGGVLREVLLHDTWGESAGPGTVPGPFVGHYVDEETGLHYNVFRYYDPLTGRFLSPDPLGLLGGLNEYVGVPDPFTWIDPEGLTAAQLADNMTDAGRPLVPGQTPHHIVEENRSNRYAQGSRDILGRNLDYSGQRGGVADHHANGARLWGTHPAQVARPGHPGRQSARTAGTYHAGAHVHGERADRLIYRILRAAEKKGIPIEHVLRDIGRRMENGTWRDNFHSCGG